MCLNINKSAGSDDWSVEILEDGTVKVETGSVAAGDTHMKAEQFMAFLEAELGGSQTRVKRAKHAHTHQHKANRLTLGGKK